MKRILTLLLFLVPIIVIAQPFNYEIKGTIKNFTPGEKLYFMHFGKARYIDSAIINTGSFSFKGSTEISKEPEENYSQSVARLTLSHDGSTINFNVIYIDKVVFRDDITVYLEPGITEVNMVDSVHKAMIIPPKVTSGHYTLDSIYTAFFKKQNKAFVESKEKHLDLSRGFRYRDSLTNVFKAEQKKDLWQFVKDHPTSPVSLYVLKHVEDDYPTYVRLARYFNPLSQELKDTQFGKAFGAKLEALKHVRGGAMAPEFAMNTPDGRSISLSSFKGKYVLIDFWASWCGPCRRENPSVVKAYDQFKDQNFTILGVSLDKDKDAWIKAIADDHLGWTQVSQLQEWDSPIVQLYAIGAIPQNFLIDPNGKIIAHNLFGRTLTKKLAQLFPVAALK